jgi:hypothetical protein
VKPDLALFAFAPQALAQRDIGADAAGDDKAIAASGFERGHRLARQHVDDRRLRRGGKVRARLLAGRVEARCVRAHGGLQSGEGEVERVPLQQRPGQRIGVRVAELGEPRQRRPTGIAEAEQLGRLVERLAGGIVDGVAEERVAADVGDMQQLRVAAGDEERDEGEGRGVGGQER